VPINPGFPRASSFVFLALNYDQKSLIVLFFLTLLLDTASFFFARCWHLILFCSSISSFSPPYYFFFEIILPSSPSFPVVPSTTSFGQFFPIGLSQRFFQTRRCYFCSPRPFSLIPRASTSDGIPHPLSTPFVIKPRQFGLIPPFVMAAGRYWAPAPCGPKIFQGSVTSFFPGHPFSVP